MSQAPKTKTEQESPERIAYVKMRLFVRIEQQIERAHRDGRNKDVASLCRLTGALAYKIYGAGSLTHSEVK